MDRSLVLEKHPTFPGVPGPVLLVILDGVGIYKGREDGYPGNAWNLADTPVLDTLAESAPIRGQLLAHGVAVGMESDADMGNSEVGHNALGAGRIFAQGAKLVQHAIESGRLFEGPVWQEQIDTVKQNQSTLHFMGLLSDGNVHSHIRHLEAMLRKAAEADVQTVRIHALLDGRDVGERSALEYVDRLEAVLSELSANGRDYRMASGGGRMAITMDRYNANWDMVAKGWSTHVRGEGQGYASTREAIESLRQTPANPIDQDLPPFVIHDNGKPVGPIVDGDAVIFFNFRGDRAIEISRAFDDEEFTRFERGPKLDVAYAGMMEYDGDLKIPRRYLVQPPEIEKTMGEYLAVAGIRQYAISETQKFGHVTYFWNGNNSEKFDASTEDWHEVPSDVIPFEQKPEMKAREITDALIEALKGKQYSFLRVNYANGDMVGHTGVLEAAVRAMETVDAELGRLLDVADEVGATVLITADHGNCDQMIDLDKSGNPRKNEDGSWIPKTSHTLNPVPAYLIGPGLESLRWNDDASDLGLSNVAATLFLMMGYKAPDGYRDPLVVTK